MRIWSGMVFAVGVFASICLTQTATAATPACFLKLGWQSSSDPTVTGYALYYSQDGGPLTNRVDVGLATIAIMTNLTVSASYSFYVVAYDQNFDESDPSNFLDYTAQAISAVTLKASADGGMSVSFEVAPGVSCHVEYSDTLAPPNWQMLMNATGDSNGVVNVVDNAVAPDGMRFYRAVVP